MATQTHERVSDQIHAGDRVLVNGFPYRVDENVLHGLSSRKITGRLVRENGSISPNSVDVVFHAHEFVTVIR